VLTGVLEAVLMQQDVGAAVALVEREVRRLLSGQAEAWELAMTGGLWRITGQQIDKAAAGGLGLRVGAGDPADVGKLFSSAVLVLCCWFQRCASPNLRP
jgi:hypothetical protein